MTPDRMGCGNWRAPDRIGEWWHLTGWGVGMLEVALAPDRMGCGNVGGAT